MATRHEFKSNKNCKDGTDNPINIDVLTNAMSDMATASFDNLRQIIKSVNLLGESLNVGRNSKKHCGCGCGGFDSHCMTCAPCGPATSSTDMTLETRLGERRRLTILIENNQKKESNFNISVAKIIDACGEEITNNELITFYPNEGNIPACKCQKVETLVDIGTNLQPGMVYYVEIKIDGQCCSNEISLGIWVDQETMIDGLVLCDPCKPRKGKFIEFSECTCGCCDNSTKYYLCDENAQRGQLGSGALTHLEKGVKN